MQHTQNFNYSLQPFFRFTDLFAKSHYRLTLAALIAIPLIIFLQSYDYEFVWDDRFHLQHGIFKEFSADTLIHTFTTENGGMFIPLSYMIWGLLKLLSDIISIPLNNVLHVTNILLHIANGLLVYLLLRNLLENRLAVFLGTLVFLIHPIQVEAVVFITELRGLLATFFGLLSLYFFIKTKQAHPPKIWFNRSLFFFVLALLSKPSAAFIPLAILLIQTFFHKDSLKQCLQTSLPFFLILFLYVALSKYLITTDYSALEIPLYHKPAVWLNTIFFYFYKLFSPMTLGASYAVTPQFLVERWWLYPVAGLTLIIAFLAWYFTKHIRLATLALCLFIAATLSTSGLITYGGYYQSMLGDRYIYFAMLAVALLVATVIDHLESFRYYMLGIFVVALLGAFSLFRQVPIWKDGVTLWTHSVQYEINKKGSYEENIATEYYNRGIKALKQKRYQEAVNDLEESLNRKPDLHMAWGVLGASYYQLGQYEQAIERFQQAINVIPDYFNHYRLANAYAQTGDYQKAKKHYEISLRKNPKYLGAHERVVIAYYNLKQYQQAWKTIRIMKRLGHKPNPKVIEALEKVSSAS